MPRVNAFGCFDDCNNFIGGYFLLKGKALFSQVFFNHNPLMAYLSMLVQLLTHPQNLYELILRHRQLLFFFGLFFNLLLITRFGLAAFGFAVFYELSKFYLFGDRFLAEGFIVYPLIYLVGLVWQKSLKEKLFLFDYILAAVFIWFVIFMREPYVPLALFLFGYILFDKKPGKVSVISFCLFFFLSLLTLFSHNVSEFFFNVYLANVNTNFLSEANENSRIGIGIIGIFFYPLLAVFSKGSGAFPILLSLLNVLFLLSTVLLIKFKKIKLVLISLLILGFANFRFVPPGYTFYAAFHLLVWYGVFLFISFMLVYLFYKKNKKISLIFMFFYAAVFVFVISLPSFFMHEKPDPHRELITNYGPQMQTGEVIKAISKPTDTLFLDGFDDIIYWQAQRISSYKYSWYTSLMPYFKKYTDARITMFKNSPPQFYYGSCPKEKDPKKLLPDFIKDQYIRLYSDKKPSCLWVKKEKLDSVTKSQWEKAKENLYYLP